jgi:mannose-1-phosphate guanylyltransferase
MLPLLDRPLLSYTFDHLRSGGVKHAILACGYLPTEIERFFGDRYDGLSLEYCTEPHPLGTGGGIRYAAYGIDRTFLALNGDSLREVDIQRLLEFHYFRGATATILLTRVPDPGRYGLVRTDSRGRVLEFVEKPPPEEIDTDLINAGMYVLEPEVLERIPPDRPVSIEREIFPKLAEEGTLFACPLPGYWLDVGTPASYLQAHLDLLQRQQSVQVDRSARIGRDTVLLPPVTIAPGAEIGSGTTVGPFVHVGHDARVGYGTSLRLSAVLPSAELPPESRLARAIVAPGIGALQP